MAFPQRNIDLLGVGTWPDGIEQVLQYSAQVQLPPFAPTRTQMENGMGNEAKVVAARLLCLSEIATTGSPSINQSRAIIEAWLELDAPWTTLNEKRKSAFAAKLRDIGVALQNDSWRVEDPAYDPTLGELEVEDFREDDEELENLKDK